MLFKVHDSRRGTFYDIEAMSAPEAVKMVQNDQWAEALDPATVTDAAQLIAVPTVGFCGDIA